MKILVLCTTDSMIWNFLVPHIQELQKNGHIVECACSVTGPYFENLKKKYNFSMHEFKFERSPYKIRNISALNQLNAFVKKEKFDTIFCHEPIGGVMGRLVGHKNGCHVIYMAHGFHFYKGSPLKNWILYYSVEKLLSYKTDNLVTINKEDYEIARKKLHSKKVTYVPGIGVDLNRFVNSNIIDVQIKREEIGIPNGAIWLLSVGELIERENHILLIDAISKINNVFLTIVGNGELTEMTHKYIVDHCLTDKVKLLGYRTDILELNLASDIFVFPSLQEGLPVALMEAMACGKPIVCKHVEIEDEYYTVLTEFERMSDHAVNIVEAAEQASLSETAQAEFDILQRLIQRVLQVTEVTFRDCSFEDAKHIEPLEEVVDDVVAVLKQNHLDRLRKGICSIDAGTEYLNMLSDIERISDICSNVGTAVIVRLHPEMKHEIHDYIPRLHAGLDETYNKQYKEVHDSVFAELKEVQKSRDNSALITIPLAN